MDETEIKIREQIGQEYVHKVFEQENNDFVRKAYKEIMIVTRRLFDSIPYTVRFEDTDPYESAKQMRAEVKKTGTIFVYTGWNGHPVLTQEENNLGRAVHDVWAHLVCGCPFSFIGEYNAFLEQRKHYPLWTWKVLFAEIIGQVCAYFYMGSISPAIPDIYGGKGNFNYNARAIEAPDHWLELCKSLVRDYSYNRLL